MVNVEAKSILKKCGVSFNAPDDMDMIRGGHYQLMDCRELSGQENAPFIFIKGKYFGGLGELKSQVENG